MPPYPIQKGIPKPPIDRSPKFGRRKYLFEIMEVGDMVFIPGGDPKSLSAYVSRAVKELPGKYETLHCWMVKASLDEQGQPRWEVAAPGADGAEEGVGVWRMA